MSAFDVLPRELKEIIADLLLLLELNWAKGVERRFEYRNTLTAIDFVYSTFHYAWTRCHGGHRGIRLTGFNMYQYCLVYDAQRQSMLLYSHYPPDAEWSPYDREWKKPRAGVDMRPCVYKLGLLLQ